jgi:uncharacterized protein YndB with AHSA1/START domain
VVPLIAEANESIAAPIERVWHAVVRLDEYAQWNPFTPEVRDVRVGEDARVDDDFTFVVRWPDGSTFISPERVLVVEPPQRGDDGVLRARFVYRFAHWLHALHLVRAMRSTWLEQRHGGPTTYRTSETMRGLLARFTPIDKVRAGFVAQARALKQRCET